MNLHYDNELQFTPNLSINLTAQSCALSSLHASGIPAAGYFQRYFSQTRFINQGEKMASYVENALTKGEQVVYQGKVSIWSLLPLLLLGLIFLAVYGLGLLFWAAAAIRYFTTELAITNKRVIAKFGLISRSTIEINLQKIESIQVNQGILGRIFNFGSIVVSGAGNPQAPIPGISSPLQFRRAFVDTQESNGQLQVAAQPA